MHVVLPSGFDHLMWGEFEPFYREQIRQNVIHWRLDLSATVTLESVVLGLIVGLNAVLESRGGSLTLVVRKKTPTADLIDSSRVNKIVNVEAI